jgi:ligand-binding sensor domain-containing protein
MKTRLLKMILTVSIAVSAQWCPGQSINPYYNFRQLNVQNGLAQDIVYHFLQDSRGYLWLGTRNGITLFDGIRSRNFRHADDDKNTLAGNFITRIL